MTDTPTSQQPDRPVRSPGEPILRIQNLGIGTRHRQLVHGVDLVVHPGERIGLIGPSGSGKSVTAQAIAALLPTHLHAHGSVQLHRAVMPASAGGKADQSGVYQELIGAPDRQIAPIRGASVSMIFQDPKAALNPLIQVGDALATAFGLPWVSRQRRKASVVQQALKEVGLSPDFAHRRPHELSGGQCQRIGIALALAKSPALLIADEPTTALDAITQAQIIDLLRQRLDATNAALIFISHDLALTRTICAHGLILSEGKVVADGPIDSVIATLDPAIRAQVQDRPGLDHNERTRSVPAVLDHPRGLPGSQDQAQAISHPGGGGAAQTPIAVAFTQVTRIHRGASTPALDAINLEIPKGARVGIVGASGAGKTTLVRLIAGLNRPTSGRITVTGRVQMVFQHPKASFNPRLRVFTSLEESLVDAQPNLSPREQREAINRVLAAVDMPVDAGDRFPADFSGGQLQRLAIARAVLGEADILIADEPVSALDTAVRTQVLEVLAQHAHQRTLIMVSHDFGPVQHLCDTIVVMAGSQIVEMGPVASLIASPQHGYTAKLLAATRYQTV